VNPAALESRLAGIAGREAVTVRALHDLWPLALMRDRAGRSAPPTVVVRPSSYEQVTQVLKLASTEGFGIAPVGGGSGVCGAVDPAGNEVGLDLSALDAILEVDEHDLTCRVQAGVVGMRLEEHLLGRGLTLGHYPSSLGVSTVGGLIATRSSGQQSTYYGSVEDLVAGLTVALPDGRVLSPLPGPRSAVGPALQQLLVGSEGGLGVILEAVLKVRRLPEETIGSGYLFKTVDAGLEAMRRVMQRDLRPLVLRLYDPEDTAFQGLGLSGCLLVVGVAGPYGVAAAQARAVQESVAPGEVLGEDPWSHWTRRRFALDAEALRRYLEPACTFVDTIEVAASWRRLPDLYREVKTELAQVGLALCHFSHAYPQGCCAYFTFGGRADDEPDAEAAYQRAWRGAMEACHRHGATISHHHGVGQVRAAWVRQELGGWWHVWEAVRAAVDHRGVMNRHAVGGRGDD
jgi:alkyldihydroxyacetonephosphate synthase